MIFILPTKLYLSDNIFYCKIFKVDSETCLKNFRPENLDYFLDLHRTLSIMICPQRALHSNLQFAYFSISYHKAPSHTMIIDFVRSKEHTNKLYRLMMQKMEN